MSDDFTLYEDNENTIRTTRKDLEKKTTIELLDIIEDMINMIKTI